MSVKTNSLDITVTLEKVGLSKNRLKDLRKLFDIYSYRASNKVLNYIIDKILNNDDIIDFKSMLYFLDYTTPTIEQTLKNFKSINIVDDNNIIETNFLAQFKNSLVEMKEAREAFRDSLRNVSVNITFDLDKYLKGIANLTDLFNLLIQNEQVTFISKKDNFLAIDLRYDSLQKVKALNLTMNRQIPLTIGFAFKCAGCGEEEIKDTTFEFNEYKHFDCSNIKQSKNPRFRLIEKSRLCIPVFVNQVYIENKLYTCVSLKELDIGEQILHGIIRAEKSEYIFYNFGVIEYDKPKIDLFLDYSKDIIAQLVNIVDDNCVAKINKKIHGLWELKVALIIQGFLGLVGHKSFNLMFYGKPGTGKSELASFYLKSMYRLSKFQDCSSLTIPGLRGSTSKISINNISYNILIPGLLEKYEATVLDEFTSLNIGVRDAMKTLLISNAITVETADQRKVTQKMASTVVTGNPYKSIQNIIKKLEIEKGKRICEFDSLDLQQLKVEVQNSNDELGFRSGYYLTGFDTPFQDRFAISFFLDGSGEKYIMKDDDNYKVLTEADLSKRLFIEGIYNYFNSKKHIKFWKLSDEEIEIVNNITISLRELVDSDLCSINRLITNVKLSLFAVAILNNRNKIIKEDGELVNKLFSCSGRFRDYGEKIV